MGHASNLWPDGVVPYDFDAGISSGEQSQTRQAMDRLEAVAAVLFIPRTTESAYLHFGEYGGNWSYVGRQGGAQDISIYNWNYPLIICHEIMHALGVWHEQQRTDRDTYVQINWGNIEAGASGNFFIQSGSTTYGVYDFDSVMHYGQYDFSTNPGFLTTIDVLPPNVAWQSLIGQRDHLSDGDQAGLWHLYPCTTNPSGVVPAATLLTPNGGEAWCALSTQTISWSEGTGIPTLYDVEFSTDGGGTWAPVESGTSSGGGSVSWYVPDAPTASGRVRVVLESCGGTDADTTDADFSILPAAAPAPSVTVPNGGEVWPAGSVQAITWTNASCPETNTTVSLSTDSGVSWSTVIVLSGAAASAGSHDWTLPASATAAGRIRVRTENDAGMAEDASDADFTITGAPVAAVTVPSGGEVWAAGSTHEIIWTNSGGLATTYAVDLSLDGGASWSPVSADAPVPAEPAHLWTLPDTAGAARVRVSLANAAGTHSAASPAFTMVSPAGAGFVNVAHGVAASTGSGQGVTWGDDDADGDLDLFVTETLSANRLLANDGWGDLSDATPAGLEGLGENSGAAVRADYDNDGDPDLYVTVRGGANHLFRNDGGVYAEATAGPEGDAGAGASAAWADYDRDGWVDLYVVNEMAPNLLLRNTGAGFADATVSPLDDSGFGTQATWADIDDDGDPDLYLANLGPNRLYRNDGGGVFVDITTPELAGAAGSYGALFADFDNDADFDLYVANTGAANVLLTNDGFGAFTDTTSPPLDDAGSAYGVAAADYDSDGDMDLFVGNSGSADRLFRNEGAGAFVNVATGDLAGSGNARGAAWGDADGDGDLDLFVANSGSADVLLQNFASGTNHWIHVTLHGTSSNASAIGARVRVVSGGGSRIRQVSGGSGYLSQESLALEFGLGSATVVDTLEVRWPDGTLQTLGAFVADQWISIVETDATDAESGILLPSRAALLPGSPNPFSGSVTLRYDLPLAGVVSLRVYDVAGRMVRTVAQERKEAGRHGVVWDGRTDGGGMTAAGIYFVRYKAGGHAETKRLVRLR
ncbi:MAG: FG-GAP-like repeat-containing protein [Gemmatimonadota bacterium]|nr:FG-GAP-like repeat-containing protein [Gemmatimonadota bacterium]